MDSQRKRRLFLGLGLVVALALAVSPASASAASTLTGENLNGVSFSGNSFTCPSPTYNVSGTATGPSYPGTFTETGGWNQGTGVFSATFMITSGTTTITGSKSGSLSASPPDALECDPEGLIGARSVLSAIAYTATIHTANGNFHDEGTSAVNADILGFISFNAGKATLQESFTSSLTAPVPVAPTRRDQCKNNGWKNFPQFKNQGQCVSSVERQSQN